MKAMAKLWKFLRWVFFVLVAALAVYLVVNSAERRVKLNVAEHLSEVVFVLDDEEVTLEDIMFYILLEEYQVEKNSLIYNSKNTKQFWNAHTNGVFISIDTKDAILDMAVHDHLMERLARDEGLLLTEDDRASLENRRSDFWEDMFDYQKEHLLVSKEKINEQIELAALGEKYVNMLAEASGVEAAPYQYDGAYYKEMLEEHKLKVNKKLWDKVVVGDITLSHSRQVTF